MYLQYSWRDLSTYPLISVLIWQQMNILYPHINTNINISTMLMINSTSPKVKVPGLVIFWHSADCQDGLGCSLQQILFYMQRGSSLVSCFLLMRMDGYLVICSYTYNYLSSSRRMLLSVSGSVPSNEFAYSYLICLTLMPAMAIAFSEQIVELLFFQRSSWPSKHFWQKILAQVNQSLILLLAMMICLRDQAIILVPSCLPSYSISAGQYFPNEKHPVQCLRSTWEWNTKWGLKLIYLGWFTMKSPSCRMKSYDCFQVGVSQKSSLILCVVADEKFATRVTVVEGLALMNWLILLQAEASISRMGMLTKLIYLSWRVLFRFFLTTPTNAPDSAKFCAFTDYKQDVSSANRKMFQF